MVEPASVKTLQWKWIAELRLAHAAMRLLIFTTLHLVFTPLGQPTWRGGIGAGLDCAGRWTARVMLHAEHGEGQESPKERPSPEVLLYSDGNSLSRGHKKEGTGFQEREHGQRKRGSCHLGHPACKYTVAQWMARVWSSWKQAVLTLPRASYILEPWRGWGLPGSTELLRAEPKQHWHLC